MLIFLDKYQRKINLKLSNLSEKFLAISDLQVHCKFLMILLDLIESIYVKSKLKIKKPLKMYHLINFLLI